jgi:hypothetical protein
MKGLLAILTWLIVLPLAGQPVTSLPPNPGGPPGLDSFPTNGLPLSPEARALIEKLQFDIEQLHPLLALANGESGIPNNAPLENGLVPYLIPEPPPPHPVPNFGKSFAGNFSQNFSVNLGQNFSTLTTVTPPGVTPLLPPNANLQLFPFPIAAPPSPPPSPAEATPPASRMRLSQNELMLLHDLEMLLQEAEADIQELLPRLDRRASRDAIPNSSGGAARASPDQPGVGSAGFNNPNANGSAPPWSGQFAQPVRNGFATSLSNQFATPLSNQFAHPLTNGASQLPGLPHSPP